MGFFNGKDFDFVLGLEWEKAVRLFASQSKGTIIHWDVNQIRVVVRERGRSVTIDFAPLRGDDIESDLRERDFTINSMALSVSDLFNREGLHIIDPLGGKKHLQDKIIHADSNISFDQDPLRILRTFRFARAFNFTIEKKTLSLLQKKAHLLPAAAPERIKRELFAILHLPDADGTLRELIHLGIIYLLFPELKLFQAVKQGPPHRHDLLEHSLKTVGLLANLIDAPDKAFKNCAAYLNNYLNEYLEEGVISRRALLMFAGLLHDSGKTMTRSVDGSRIRFLGHEAEGLKLNQQIGRRLLLGKKALRVLETVTKNHMRILQLSELKQISAQAQNRLLRDIEKAPLEVLLLARADVSATSTEDSYKKTKDRVEHLVEQLAETFLSSARDNVYEPLVTGEDILKVMKIPEGQAVGDLLREIHEGERQGIFNSREEVITWLKQKKKSG